MVFTINNGLACWWLTNDDANNEELMSSIMVSIKEYQRQGYMTATYHSGTGDLKNQTRQLLKNNSGLI